MTVHPTALIEAGARLYEGVEIGPWCIVGASVVLHEGVRLDSHVVIGGHTEIGARTHVYSHAVLGGDAQIKGHDSASTRLLVGADNVIRESVTISTGSRSGRGTTRVGEHCYLMAGCHIAHDCTVGDSVTLSNGVQLGGHVELQEGVIMGGLSAIQQFGRVGRFAFISGVTGVVADVIPYGAVIGTHARLYGLNLVGLKRRGVPRANIHALRGAYQLIFESGTGTIQENAHLAGERWSDFPEVGEVVAFILADAKRPICPARRRGRDAQE